MGLPRLNLLCPAALQGFCYRALADEANPADAPLTARRLEDLQSAKTEVMLSLSALRTDVQIAKERVISAEQDAEEAGLDLRIFNDEYPPPPPRKGIFAKGLSPEQKKLKAQRLELEQISEQCKKDYSAKKDSATKLAYQLERQEKELSAVGQKQAKLTHELSSQVAAEVIGKVIVGEADSARRRLVNLRQMSRGNLMLGVLSVVVELLADGPGAARKALADARLIFEQHPDPIVPVLEVLIDVVDGKPQAKKSPCGYDKKFSLESFNFLAELAAVLDGRAPENTEFESPQFMAMVGAICQAQYPDLPDDEWAMFPAKYMVDIARNNDLVIQTLICSSFMLPDRRLWMLSAAGLAHVKFLDPSDPYDAPAELMKIIKRHNNPAWPKALTQPWQVALASLALLGAQINAPEDVFEQWLDESYNWPKCDLYWWVLAEIKQDKALLKNISGKPTELFTVDPV